MLLIIILYFIFIITLFDVKGNVKYTVILAITYQEDKNAVILFYVIFLCIWIYRMVHGGMLRDCP